MGLNFWILRTKKLGKLINRENKVIKYQGMQIKNIVFNGP